LRIQKRYRIFLIPLLLSVLLFSCGESKVQNLQKRLDAFREILPEKVRRDFDSKSSENVVKGIDSLLAVDASFQNKYDKVKDQEAINVFSVQEVVDFYKEYFVMEIEKLKQIKDKEKS